MAWTIRFYELSNGRKPVAEFIRELTVIERTKVTKTIARMQERGPQGVESAPVGDKVFEVKIGVKNTHRIFYVTMAGQTIVFLHAVTKKSTRVQNDIELAKRRAREVLGE